MLGTCKAIGDIDATTGPAFSAALRDSIDRSDQTLVIVDCSGVTFMDPTGYHALVDATRYAARHGHTLVIRNMSPSCTRLMRLYAWDRELRVEPSPKRTQKASTKSCSQSIRTPLRSRDCSSRRSHLRISSADAETDRPRRG